MNKEEKAHLRDEEHDEELRKRQRHEDIYFKHPCPNCGFELCGNYCALCQRMIK